MEAGNNLMDDTENPYARVVRTVVEEAAYVAASAMQASANLARIRGMVDKDPVNEEGEPGTGVS